MHTDEVPARPKFVRLHKKNILCAEEALQTSRALHYLKLKPSYFKRKRKVGWGRGAGRSNCSPLNYAEYEKYKEEGKGQSSFANGLLCSALPRVEKV